MRSTVNSYIADIKDAHRKKRAFTAVLCVLAFVVALAVMWQFKVTGISIAGDANVSDSDADVETSTQWEETLPATLTDDWQQNTAAIAESQIGYTESTKNFIMDADGETRKGYTRYGAWFGSEYNDWDAMFASFCLHYAGVSEEMFPRSLGAYSWTSELAKQELLADPTTYEATAGDLVFFDTDDDQRAETVGVVTNVAENGGEITVVQGDSNNRVEKQKYSSTNKTIVGYGMVPQNPALLAKQAAQAQAAQEAAAAAAANQATDAQGAENGEAVKEEGDSSSSDEADPVNPVDSAAHAATKKGTPATTAYVDIQWTEGDAPVESVNVHLIKNGDYENPVAKVTLSEDNEWQQAFRDLPTLDAEGAVINYTTINDQVEGYSDECFTQDALANHNELSLLQMSQIEVPEDELRTAEEKALDKLNNETRTLSFSYAYSPAEAGEEDIQTMALSGTSVPVTINKVWSDGNDNHTGESVTFKVTENGYTREVKVTAAGNWTTTFNTTDENISIQEVGVNGYETEITRNSKTTDYWLPASNFTDNGTYAVFYGGKYALNKSGSYFNATTMSPKTSAITINGTRYTNYLTDVPAVAQWKALDSYRLTGTYSGYYALQNVSSGEYIRGPDSSSVTDSYFYLSSGGYVPLKYTYSAYYASTLRAGSYYYMYDNGYSSQTSSKATDYTLYKKTTVTQSITFDVANRRLTASDESGTSINVVKEWEDGSNNHDPIVVDLLDEQGNVVAGTKPVTLSAGNNWRVNNAWTNLSEQAYTVAERTVDGYDAFTDAAYKRNTIWVPVNQMTNGGIYAFVDTSNIAIATPPRSGATGTSGIASDTTGRVTYGSDNLSMNGTTYQRGTYLVNVPENFAWTAQQVSANEFELRTASANFIYGAYMYSPMVSNYQKLLTGAKGTNDPTLPFTYENGYLKQTYPGKVGYVSSRVPTSSAYEPYHLVSSTSGAQKFTLYKMVNLTERTYTITNIPTTSVNKPAVQVENKKYIDAFRDGKSNPDSSFGAGTDLTDLYRLYLDATAKASQEPIDLLLVLDYSGSMASNTTLDLNGSRTTMSRKDVLVRILNGTNYQNGLIGSFLRMNPNNHVSVVGFSGKGSVYSTSYSDDAETLVGWTSSWNSTNGSKLSAKEADGGTNYSAGLLEASNVFAKSTSGNKKVMVFLSDGVPTFYVAKDDKDINNNGNKNENIRYGNGSSEQGNASLCNEPSKNSFDDFKLANPNVITYSLGFSPDIEGDLNNVSTNPAVLRYYAERGNGDFIQASDGNELNAELSKLLAGAAYSNAAITDQLSWAVDYYEAQPDLKFERVTTNANGSENHTVLWQGSAVTNEGRGIVRDVSYDANTKSVTATFEPSYLLETNCRYVLSFNVRTTDEAYNTYVQNVSKGVDGYDGNTGDANTDYLNYKTSEKNDTSSNKPGFDSNQKASFNFKSSGYTYQMGYNDPVIQVGPCAFEILKLDSENANHALQGAQFSLYRPATTGETGVALEGREGTYVKVNTGGNITTGRDGRAYVENLAPGEYFLVEEVAPEGYQATATPQTLTLTRGAITVNQEGVTEVGENHNGRVVLNFKNKAGYELPETGGPGDQLPLIIGVTLMVGALVTRCTVLRKRDERRKGRVLP